VIVQILIFPVLDTGMQTESYKQFARGYMLTADAMRYFVETYLPDASTRSKPDAAPLQAPSLKGVPPAIIVLAGCDPLRDEGRAYGKRLLEVGVDTTVLVCALLAHVCLVSF
jgi:acetyl esterase